jgi:hypothetical protein
MIIGKIYGLFERANDDYVMKKLGMGREFFRQTDRKLEKVA